MAEIKLEKRYPDSRAEDITDAYMRGVAAGRALSEREIMKLRDLVAELLPYAGSSCPEECRYQEECEDEGNLSTNGWPLTCVAYGHLIDAAKALGVEVD